MRIATLLCFFAAALPMRAQDDVLMRAMRDEMARSMKELQLANLEKPYYIAYRAIERDNTAVGASFGALNHSNTNRSRMFNAEVRVGDYKFDNTNFFSINFGQGTEIRTASGIPSFLWTTITRSCGGRYGSPPTPLIRKRSRIFPRNAPRWKIRIAKTIFRTSAMRLR